MLAIVALVFVVVVVALTVYCARERRRLTEVEREVRPLELVKECFHRDDPGILVRSPEGIAVNFTHPGTYAWAAYLIGLMALAGWQVVE